MKISTEVRSPEESSEGVVRAPRLAVIVPCYNEAEAVEATVVTLLARLAEMKREGRIGIGSYVLLVDDGSTDATTEILSRLADRYPSEVALLMLAANVGHQNALMAGIETAAERCDISVSIDADLQDAPEAIREMVDKYAEGCDIVYGVRRSRASDSWFKRNTALCFYRMMRGLGVKSVYNHADFRLMSSRAMRQLCRYGESNLFLRGLVPKLGYHQAEVYYDRRPRQAGRSKYPLGRMINFMLDGITSFSVKPVRMIFTLGLLFTLFALGMAVYIAIRWAQGHVVAGWSSMMLSIWFCTGVLLMSLGVIGEYLGKIYTEVKRRPRYNIDRFVPPSPVSYDTLHHTSPDSRISPKECDKENNRDSSMQSDIN